MSAMGGILNFGNTPPPVDRLQLAELGAGLDAHGTDGGRELISGNVGMSYRAFRTTPESRLEVQPLVTPEPHILAWNGRLDNREELIRQLRDQPHSDLTTITDLEIVMAAYLKWNKACFVRLIGDFCLALWDARLKVLYLVRDVVGTRTLNFHIDSNRIIWSTPLTVLLNIAGGSWEIEDEYIAGVMTRGPEPGLTPFKNVHAVKPAHVVTVTQDGRLREERYWGLDPNKEIRYKTDEEYEEHFLHDYSEGLQGRLRSHLPVFVELSGGLDSSSNACMSDQLIASGKVQAPRIETVSYVFDESPSADERKFIRYVEEHRGVLGHYIREEDYRYMTPLTDISTVSTPNPILASSAYHTRVCGIMSSSGARVLLSGLGGDELLHSTNDPTPELSDLLVQGKIVQLHRRLQIWSTLLRRPYSGLLWNDAVVPVLPLKLKRVFRRGANVSVPSWFNEKFVARLNLRDRMLGTTDIFGFRSPSAQDQAIGFISVAKNVSAGYLQETGNREVSYPYLHRPLVEFLQAIPFEQKLRPGESRSLMRRALRDVLPEGIAKRRGKGNPTEAVLRAIARESVRLRPMFEEALVCAYGYMDAERLLTALDRARIGLEVYSGALTKTITLEFWLRTLESRSFAVRNSIAMTGEMEARPMAVRLAKGSVMHH